MAFILFLIFLLPIGFFSKMVLSSTTCSTLTVNVQNTTVYVKLETGGIPLKNEAIQEHSENADLSQGM